jgi:predicted nucleotidyltransferase
VSAVQPQPGARVIPAEIRAAVAEFAARAGSIPGLACAILYGSAVRDELHRGSDLDLFLIFDGSSEESKEGRRIARDLADAAVEAADCPYYFACLPVHLDEVPSYSPHFLLNVVREGIVIWARPDFVFPPVVLGRTPLQLITFRVDGLPEEVRLDVQRALSAADGGLVQGEVRQIADGVLLAPPDATGPILTLLQTRGIEVATTTVWANGVPYHTMGEAMKAKGHLNKARQLESGLNVLLASSNPSEIVALVTEAIFGIAQQYISYGLEVRYGEHPDTHAGMPQRLIARGHPDIAQIFKDLTERRMGLWYGAQENGPAIAELQTMLERIRAWAIA